MKIKNIKRNQGWTALPVAVVLALVLAACGSDNNTSSASSTAPASAKPSCAPAASIDGAGSTFVATIVQQWVKDYQAACPGTTINYKGGGSGAGVTQITAGTVQFAGSDVPLQPAELTAAEAKYGVGNVVTLPWSAGGIAIEYNLAGVTNLQLSAATLASIFTGKVTKWNDPLIADDNHGVVLPATTIQVVHRSDGSGTSAAFTAYMTSVAPSVWTIGSAKDPKWPVGQGAKGSDGVTSTVKQTDGSIGYAELSYAKAVGVSTAAIMNASGKYVQPSDAGAVEASLAAATVNTDGSVKLNFQATDSKAYPIATVTYLIAPKNASNAAQGELVQLFAQYALNGGQASAAALGYTALPDSIKQSALSAAATLAPSSSPVAK